MKNSKRLLALLLSVMLIMGAVMSVPFTASAKNLELQEVGASSLKFSDSLFLGDEVKPGQDYYSIADPEVRTGNPVYAWFDALEVGYYVLYIKNNGMTTGSVKLNVAFTDNKDNELDYMTVADGEEQELSLRIEQAGRYYIRLFYDYKNSALSGNIDLKLSSFADAEPDKMDPTITITPASYFFATVDVAEDKDYIFVQTANNKKYSVTLENRNDNATAFKAEVYDSKSNLVGTLTTEAEDIVTLELAKPKDTTSYYICVTGIDGALGEYGLMMNEVKPVAVEVPLNEEFYDSITGFDTEGGRDYLKFNTIDKDAYYTVTVKNINITTHSWAADNEVQADVLNSNDEKLGNINLTKGDEKSITLKLEPNTTYYMRVYNNYLPDTNGGNYKVQISYVLDPDKNEMENATDWTLEEKYFGDVAARGDSDWFKITTNEETDYTFTLKNINIPTHSWSPALRFRGVIYNDKSEELTTLMMYSGEELSTRITLDPDTTYYIRIWDPQGTTGEYSFDLSKTVIIDEEAVGMANAVEIPYNEDYYDSITNWDGDNKVDFLKFTTLQKPAYYTLTAKNINIPTHSWSGDNQVQVKIQNEHKEEIARLTLAEGGESTETLLLDTNTTYYIRINNNENNGGNYKVNLTYTLDPEPNEMEKGKTLRIGERYYGNIAASGDKDFFKITTGKKTDLTLLLKNINIPTHSWSGDHQFRVVLYNKYSEQLGVILATNGTEGNIKVTLEPDTTYYLGVWDPDNTKGDYNVILAESVLVGDVDLDEAVKIKDATLIQKALAKLAELDDKQNAVADVTEDGKVNIKDATAIQKFLAKIETPYKTGQLILSEIEYDEPASEPTEPSSVVLTEPITTTAVADKTEPTEAVPTTEVTEPTEVVTDATEATTVTEATDATTAEPESTAAETDPVPTGTLSQIDTLRALNEEAHELLDEYNDYENEFPLDKDSEEIQLKKQLGYADSDDESYGITEYEKFFRANDRITYYLMHGYQYVDDHSEYIALLSNAMEWFKYYVTEVHPEPVSGPRIIYLDNALGWESPHIYFWNSESGEHGPLWPGMKMTERGSDYFTCEVPREFDRIVFCSTEDSKYYSVEIEIDTTKNMLAYRLVDKFDGGYAYEDASYMLARPTF